MRATPQGPDKDNPVCLGEVRFEEPAAPSPTVADLAERMLVQLQDLRREKALNDALTPLVRALSMATIESLKQLTAAAHRVIDAWRSSSLSDPDPAELREAIEDLVAASGWKRADE